MAGVVHIHPLDDVIQHDTATEDPDCVCGPQVRPEKQNDGSIGYQIVHHSLDGRERHEGGEAS